MKNQQTFNLTKQLLIATFIAAITLLFFILPAEYNVDPTGVGKSLGLTRLATSKEINQEQTQDLKAVSSKTKMLEQKDTVQVIVPAGKGVEYKFSLNAQQTMTYEWQTQGPALYLDLHGEPEGDTTGYYESYTIATSHKMSGQFTAPFNGVHGWYWKNKTDKDISLILTTSGPYQVLGLKK